jgi:hypothetical protein
MRGTGPAAPCERGGRREREAAALRDNLRRRKAQARVREAGGHSVAGTSDAVAADGASGVDDVR